MHPKTQIIAVTGAAGFIGSNLCQKLLTEGYSVIAVDNLSKGNKKNINQFQKIDRFKFIKLDILDYKKTQKALSKAQVIIHLAASKIPRYGNRLETLLTNTKGTENILEIAKKTKAKVIFASTSDVYGKNTALPFNEESDLVLGPSSVARWAYAVSKIYDEHLIMGYHEKYKISFTIIRFFGIYGPNQHRSWWGGPQSLFIDTLLSNKPVEIHGSGEQTRTFLYIDDAIDAILSIIKTKEAKNQIINLGSNKELSMFKFAQKIASVMNKSLKIKKVSYLSFTGEKYEDVQKRVPNTSKAKTILKWAPKTSLETGLKKTIEWYKNNPV